VIVELPSEATARALQERCIMADKVLELWGHGRCVGGIFIFRRSIA
jgi:hypothetical protein